MGPDVNWRAMAECIAVTTADSASDGGWLTAVHRRAFVGAA
jgi:hypothetical protein